MPDLRSKVWGGARPGLGRPPVRASNGQPLGRPVGHAGDRLPNRRLAGRRQPPQLGEPPAARCEAVFQPLAFNRPGAARERAAETVRSAPSQPRWAGVGARGGKPTLRQTRPRPRTWAQSAFKDSMVHIICNSHYVSHFAAFFIVAGAKISVVESCHLVCGERAAHWAPRRSELQ